MIVGLGIDLIELDRVRRVLERHGRRFFDRVLTAGEQDYCLQYRDPAPSVGARFAAKEAVSKALGTGLARGIRWVDIEVLRDSQGAPGIALYGKAADLAKEREVDRVHLSLSHDRQAAVAVAILERLR